MTVLWGEMEAELCLRVDQKAEMRCMVESLVRKGLLRPWRQLQGEGHKRSLEVEPKS